MGHFLIQHCRHRLSPEGGCAGAFTARRGAKPTVEKTLNRAGATPLFRLSAAHNFVGSLPPCGTDDCAECFFSTVPEKGTKASQKHPRRDETSIIKKAPAIKTREVHLEEPVNELLDDYARFIESTPDHVLNAALKKVLWRDQDYRKWREQRRSAPEKSSSTDARGRA